MRRDGDSNPGYAFDVYTLSRRASSATRASLRTYHTPYKSVLFAIFGYKNIFFFVDSHILKQKSCLSCAFFVQHSPLFMFSDAKNAFHGLVRYGFKVFFAYIIYISQCT